MSQQSDRTLPHLADIPFLEKPPLSYWLSGASIQRFGDSAAAARAPNVLYAIATALSLGALAYAMFAVAKGSRLGSPDTATRSRLGSGDPATLTPVERRQGREAA